MVINWPKFISRLTLVLGVTSILIYGLVSLIGALIPDRHRDLIKLETKQAIVNDTRITATPFWDRIGMLMEFDVIIETTKNTPYLKTNFAEQTILQLPPHTALDPVQWDKTSHKKYEKKGRLIFQLSEAPTQNIDWIVFVDESTTLSWSLAY